MDVVPSTLTSLSAWDDGERPLRSLHGTYVIAVQARQLAQVQKRPGSALAKREEDANVVNVPGLLTMDVTRRTYGKGPRV